MSFLSWLTDDFEMWYLVLHCHMILTTSNIYSVYTNVPEQSLIFFYTL